MGLKYMVESLDGLEDSVKGLYVEQDGKFQLAVDGIEDAYVPKSNFVKERDARRAAEERAKNALSEEDAEEFERLRQLADKGRNTDEILTRWKEKAAKKEAADAEALRAERQRRASREMEITASELIAKHKGNVRLLKDHVLRELRVEEIDGDITIAPLRATSLEEIISSFKKDPDFAAAFADSGHSGSGATGGHAGAGGKKTMALNDFNKLAPKERAAFMAANGVLTE